MRNRAGVILIEDNKLALIERYRANMHYFVIPGGGVDKGETPEQAAIREAEEELGLQVRILQKVAEVKLGTGCQFYFVVERIGGEFGTGTGEEYMEPNPKYGTYHPVWMPVDELPRHDNVYPSGISALIAKSIKSGWPANPITLVESAD